MNPQEIAEAGLLDRGPIAPQRVPTGAASLARAAEKAAADQPYSFHLTTFNILGSQHSAPGGPAARFAPGRIRTEWAADLIAAYGSDVVGLQEIQADQLATLARATDGRFDFWPGTSMGGKGIPQNLMWRSAVWTPTFQGSITIPFMGTTRPQPVVRLQHIATGREIYVMNVHNSPNDRAGPRGRAGARRGDRDRRDQGAAQGRHPGLRDRGLQRARRHLLQDDLPDRPARRPGRLHRRRLPAAAARCAWTGSSAPPTPRSAASGWTPARRSAGSPTTPC